MNLYGCLEAINFQHKSKLAANITAAIQDVFDYKKKLVNTPLKEAATLIREYFIKNTVPKLTKAIKEGTGFTLKEVKTSRYLNLMYACVTNLGDGGVNSNKFMDEYSGLGNTELFEAYLREKGFKCVTASDMRKITESLNKDTGVFKQTSLKDGSKVSITLYFDTYSAFLFREIVHEKCKEFTAEEIASVVLHELGHVHSCLERCLDGCFRAKLIEGATQYFFRHATLEEKTKFLVDCLKAKGHEALGDKILQMLRIFANTPSQEVVVPKDSVGSAVIGPILTLLSTLFLVIDLICMFWARGFVRNYVEDIGGTNKTGDLRTTTDNIRLIERLADQFCVRHGLGPAHISFENKVEYNYTYFQGCTYGTLRQSKIAWWSAYLPMILGTLINGQLEYAFDEHDPATLRMKKTLEDTLAVFKNADIDPEMRADYIAIYEQTLNVFKSRCFAIRLSDGAELFHQMLEYIWETPLSLIGTGRFQQEYIRLVNRTNKLLNNTLYYRAAKLEELIK